MPLQPNVLERQLLKRGVLPPLMVDGAAASFQLTALIGAMDTGVVRTLGRHPGISLEALAERTGTDPRALDNLLGALDGLGWVEQQNGGWTLTAAVERSIPTEDFDRFAPFFKHQVAQSLDAQRALRDAPEDGIIGWDSVREGEVAESYQALMRWLASGSVDEVVKRADIPDGANRLLDIGGSHGLYSVAFCRKHPELRATVLDWPVGLREAQRTLEGGGSDVAGRIDLAEVDFEQADELPGGYDVAFLGNIVHGLDVEGNAKLFEKIGRATNERATVLIVDQFRGGRKGSRFAQGFAGLIGWNLFLFSGGRAHTLEDLSRALAAGGFGNAERTDLRRTPGFSLLSASK